MKRLILISVGMLNLLHGLTHIFQFIQSIILINYATSNHEEHSFLDSPCFSILWAIIGLATLIIGVKDYLHYRKCKKHGH